MIHQIDRQRAARGAGHDDDAAHAAVWHGIMAVGLRQILRIIGRDVIDIDHDVVEIPVKRPAQILGGKIPREILVFLAGMNQLSPLPHVSGLDNDYTAREIRILLSDTVRLDIEPKDREPVIAIGKLIEMLGVEHALTQVLNATGIRVANLAHLYIPEIIAPMHPIVSRLGV